MTFEYGLLLMYSLPYIIEWLSQYVDIYLIILYHFSTESFLWYIKLIY